jgi:hypothetical protein
MKSTLTSPKAAAVTICSINYISKALVLIDTYKKYHPEHSFYLILVDRKRSDIIIDRENVNVVWVSDLGITDILKYAFTYDIIEFNTNVKPAALALVLKNHDAAIYLDPDIKIYAPLTSVFAALESASVVVTPHCNTPILDGHKPDDLELLKFGAFNLGFVGVSKCNEGFDFLNWWSARCLEHGFYEPQAGLGVDQKWVGLAPCFFPSMQILHDEGLNVAFWNLHERTLTQSDGAWIVNSRTNLKFIHFSSFSTNNPDNIAEKQTRFRPGSRPDFAVLARAYAHDLIENASEKFSKIPYGFDYFDDGTYVTPALRRFYAQLKLDVLGADENPFSSDGAVLKFAKKNGLLLKSNSPSKRHTFKDMGAYSLQIKIINKMLRIVLYLVGPERYFNLMRYLAHISSLRNQTDMFGKIR